MIITSSWTYQKHQKFVLWKQLICRHESDLRIERPNKFRIISRTKPSEERWGIHPKPLCFQKWQTLLGLYVDFVLSITEFSFGFWLLNMFCAIGTFSGDKEVIYTPDLITGVLWVCFSVPETYFPDEHNQNGPSPPLLPSISKNLFLSPWSSLSFPAAIVSVVSSWQPRNETLGGQRE